MRAPLLPQAVVPFSGDADQVKRDAAVEALRGELAVKVLLRARLITGERDDAAPGGLTDGVSFTSGTAKVIDHGLGEECIGFIEVRMPSETAGPALAPTYDATLDPTRQIKVTPGATAKARLLVIPRSAVVPR